MAHIYSVEIHDYLSNEIRKAEQELARALTRGEPRTARYYQGRLEELLHFRNYLSERIDLKTQNYY